MILVGMLALTISIRMASAVWDPDADVIQDGKIDGKDLAYIAKWFGTYPGSSRGWNSTCDVVPDLKIDGRDLVSVAKNFGSVAPPP